MKAAVFEDIQKVKVRELEKPEPLPGEVLIRSEYCLLCTWEQRIFSGQSKMDLPFIAGHEAAGQIEEVPPDTITGFKKGDKVVFKTLDHCGHCSFCYSGFDNQCIGKVKKRIFGTIPGSGGLAQYISLPVQRIFPIAGDLPLQQAAFAEPLACCLHSVKRSRIAMGDTVAIFGMGIMGQLHSILACLQGARVIVFEPVMKRREFALLHGAQAGFDPLNEDPVNVIKQLTKDEGADVVFITANIPDLVTTGLKALKDMGRLILYGSFHPTKNLPLDPNSIHYSEVVISGSCSPSTSDFAQAARLLSYNLVSVEAFIDKIFPLEKIDEAMRLALAPDSYRVAVKLQ